MKQILDQIKKIVKENSNDQVLGKQIRELMYQLSKSK